MKAPPVTVVDQPREFAVDELFFSTTDRRGIIKSGNDVFVRISGYPEAKLLGSAHNIIRHPDMPRSVFRLMWRRLGEAKPVAAVVKNLASDGRHYWVVALITPTEEGFLSVRFKPTGKFLALAAPLYARMRAAEQDAAEKGLDATAIMDAGERILEAALAENALPDFEAYMRVLLCEEMKSRDATLTREHRRIVQPRPTDWNLNDPIAEKLSAIYAEGLVAYQNLNRLYVRLDEFVSLNETLAKKSSFVNHLTDDLRISSMNVALASSRLGGEGEGLQVISRHMGESSGDVAKAVDSLVRGIGKLSAQMRGVIFNLSSARLQVEVFLKFGYELLQDRNRAARWEARRGLMRELHRAFSHTMQLASRVLHEMDDTARPLTVAATELERQVLSLQVSQLGGVVEGTRIPHGAAILDIFAAIRHQIDSTRAELNELGDALGQIEKLSAETPFVARAIESAGARMDQDINLLSQLTAMSEAPVVEQLAPSPAPIAA